MLISIITGSQSYAQGIFIRDLKNGTILIRCGEGVYRVGRPVN